MNKYISQTWVIALVLIGCTSSVFAQSDIKKMPIQVAALSILDLGDPISYSPGMTLDFGIRIAGSSKEKKSGLTKDRDFYLKPFIGFYKRENYHTGAMLGTDLTFRATTPSGIFWDANIGLGYLHLFYNAPTYVYENGSFVKKKMQGYANMVAKGAVNIGYDFSKSGKLPLGIYAGMGLQYRYPNNGSSVRAPFFQLGAMYTIKKSKS